MMTIFLTKELEKAIKEDSFDSLVATYYVSSDDIHRPLSLFKEMRWRLPDEIFPVGTNESAKWLDFSKLPSKFIHTMKVATLRYIRFRNKKNNKKRRGRSIVGFLETAVFFLKYAEPLANSLASINQIIFANYVYALKNYPAVNGKILTPGVIRYRLQVVERIYILTEGLSDPLPKPWPTTNAYEISGRAGSARNYVATAHIPDDILAKLFQQAIAHLEKAEHLLSVKREHKKNLKTSDEKSRGNSRLQLQLEGYDGTLISLNEEINYTLTACIIIILTTTGIRSNELLSMTVDGYFTTIENGVKIKWIRGMVEDVPKVWICNTITHKAIEIAVKITQDLRDELITHIADLKKSNVNDRLLSTKSIHQKSIFLSVKSRGEICTFGNCAVNRRLKRFAELAKVDWRLASHQFRPTFAFYVVRSRHGDYRYMKEHFGHANLDMLISYSHHGEHDASLLEDIGFAYSEYKQSTLEHMLFESTYLAGGLAEPVKKFGDQIKTYKNRSTMVKSVSNDIYLRATSVGWCANDKGDCIGGDGVERTRCAKDGGCVHFLADETSLPVWREIEAQQLELIELEDIGDAGRARVARDLERCRSVIAQLDPERM
ncbi:tyrosine-type recombinase/integrase [Pseudomonas sp. S2_E02]